MPYEDPDSEDPMVFVGVAAPVASAEAALESQREMACVFAEEFSRMGYSAIQVMALFQKPFYAGAHMALQQLGQDEIRKIIDETVAVWGRMRWVDRDADPLAMHPGAQACSGRSEE